MSESCYGEALFEIGSFSTPMAMSTVDLRGAGDPGCDFFKINGVNFKCWSTLALQIAQSRPYLYTCRSR